MRHATSRQRPLRGRGRGLTVIEVMVTLICLAVAAVIVLPTVSDNSGERLRGAAQILVADLEYAQSESMSHGDDPRRLVIDADKLGYYITKKSAPLAPPPPPAPKTPVNNPVGGMPYVTRFGSDRAAMLGGVSIGAYDLGGDDRLGFGALGQLDQSAPATIELLCGVRKIVVTIDPTTGDVSMGEVTN